MYDEIDRLAAKIARVMNALSAIHAQDVNGDYTFPPLVTKMRLLKTAYKQRFPRRKFIWYKVMAEIPNFEEINNKYNSLVERHYRRLQKLRKALYFQAAQAAMQVPVPKTAEMRLWRECSSSTFRSSGLNANHHARTSAEHLIEEVCKPAGIEAEVRLTKSKYVPSRDWYGRECGMTWEEYGVFVATDERGCELLGLRDAHTRKVHYAQMGIDIAY